MKRSDIHFTVLPPVLPTRGPSSRTSHITFGHGSNSQSTNSRGVSTKVIALTPQGTGARPKTSVSRPPRIMGSSGTNTVGQTQQPRVRSSLTKRPQSDQHQRMLGMLARAATRNSNGKEPAPGGGIKRGGMTKSTTSPLGRLLPVPTRSGSRLSLISERTTKSGVTEHLFKMDQVRKNAPVSIIVTSLQEFTNLVLIFFSSHP